MKFLSDLIHKTPWWFLLGGGLLTLAALAVFVTPFQLIRLEKSAATSEQKRAIQREIDFAFSEGAIDVARGIVKELRAHTKDPARRAELDQALAEIDDARKELREAGREVIRAKRDAAQGVTDAVRDATRAITDAQREAARALKEAGVDDKEVIKALEASVIKAKEAEVKAREDAVKNANERVAEAQRRYDEAKVRAEERRRAIIGKAENKGKKEPGIHIEMDHGDKPAPPALPDGTSVVAPPVPPVPALTPEMRDDIHKRVSGDLRRIGVGAGMILVFIPLFILAIVSKYFIDRSRASMRFAESERREAEYHRMAQQVTEAKLQALQAQVEPHFLYSTLASVQALTEVDPARANTLTGHLIMYLRNALPKMRESVSTVAQEVELVRSYLNILKMRMGDRLAFEIDVPSSLENAIKHGLEPLREGGTITVKAEERDGILRISVADTGKGFGESESVGGSGVGLANIRERLAAIYGDKGKLTLEENQPRGVISAIEVPRDGMRVAGNGTAKAGDPILPPKPEAPTTAAGKTFAAFRTGERMWRKGLSFTFMALTIVAAVACGLALVAVITGILPIQFGDGTLEGPTGIVIGTALVLLAFILIVIALAVVIAVFYGLGFVLVGLLVFVTLSILVALVPALAPFILVGLFVWWLIRRSDRKKAAKAAAEDAARKEPTLESAQHADGNPR